MKTSALLFGHQDRDFDGRAAEGGQFHNPTRESLYRLPTVETAVRPASERGLLYPALCRRSARKSVKPSDRKGIWMQAEGANLRWKFSASTGDGLSRTAIFTAALARDQPVRRFNHTCGAPDADWRFEVPEEHSGLAVLNGACDESFPACPFLCRQLIYFPHSYAEFAFVLPSRANWGGGRHWWVRGRKTR